MNTYRRKFMRWIGTSRWRIVAASILMFSAGRIALAAQAGKIDLTPILSSILKQQKTPAIIAAIVDGSRVSAIGAAGVRKIGSDVPVTVNDLIHLGSDTKAMTAMLIGQLIETRQLAFDTTMDQVFPNLAARMNPAAAKITIRQLLNHTSGLPVNVDWWQYDRNGGPIAAQRLAVVKDLLNAKPRHVPGTQFEYSNAGYVVLGAVLEQKTHFSWEELIRKKIFAPLKMTSAGFGPPGPIGQIQQPWGHTLQGDALVPSQTDNPPVMGPAGRVHCTIGDWAKFISQFLPHHPGQPDLLSPSVLRQLITPSSGTDYAGGWMVVNRPWGGGAVLTHSGSNTMWYCVAWVAPKMDFAVLVATNVGGNDARLACDQTARALIQLHQKLQK